MKKLNISMRTVKISCIAVLVALAAVCIYQNTAVMQLTFLFWSVSMSKSLMVLASFFAGFIAGVILLFLRAGKKCSNTKAENIR